MGELLIFFWPYHTSFEPRVATIELLIMLMLQTRESKEECVPIVRKAIASDEMADRLNQVLCMDLRRKSTVDDDFRNLAEFLQMVVHSGSIPLKVGAVNSKENIIRAVAIACQRQLCCGKGTELNGTDFEFYTIQKSFSYVVWVDCVLQYSKSDNSHRTILKAHGAIVGLHGNTALFEPKSIGILAQIGPKLFRRARKWILKPSHNLTLCSMSS